MAKRSKIKLSTGSLTNGNGDITAGMTGIDSGMKPVRKGRPPVGESSGPQGTLTGMPFVMGGGGLLSSVFGTGFPSGPAGLAAPGAFNSVFPGGFPGVSVAFGGALFGFGANGFIQPRKGAYPTYRLMSLHPTLRLVRHIINAPIIASQWTVQAVKGHEPQQAWLDLIEDTLLPHRAAYLKESLRYLEFGWRPFEKVWEVGEDGRYRLRKLKPMLPDLTQILHDGKGNFAGLTQLSGDDGLRADKTFLVTYDGEAGNLYGMSRHEAAFDPWVDWQADRMRAAVLNGKLSGYLPILYYRPGETPTANGNVDNKQIATMILATAGLGNGCAVPTTEYADDELQQNPELTKISPWRLEMTDCGNYAPAIDGMIRTREYADKLMVRGWCWPERAVLESQRSGSRADSQQHSDNSELDRELIDDDLASQFTRGQPEHDVPGVVDDVLRLNFGEAAVGTVEIVPAPLVDKKVQVYTSILQAILQDPSIAPMLLSKMDNDSLLEGLDIDKLEEKDADQQLKTILSIKQQTAEATRPPVVSVPGLQPDGKPGQQPPQRQNAPQNANGGDGKPPKGKGKDTQDKAKLGKKLRPAAAKVLARLAEGEKD